jgi:hypothetical protein
MIENTLELLKSVNRKSSSRYLSKTPKDKKKKKKPNMSPEQALPDNSEARGTGSCKAYHNSPPAQQTPYTPVPGTPI